MYIADPVIHRANLGLRIGILIVYLDLANVRNL